MAALAALAWPFATGAQEPGPASEWRAGVEVGPRPALLARWEARRAGWIAGVDLALGAGEGPVRLRATPQVRLGRAVGRHLTLAGGLGLEWARLGRGWNSEESEIQWELAAGWRTAGALQLEAGVRWTDYRRPRSVGVFRVSAPLSVDASPGHLDREPPEDPSVPSLPGVPAAAGSGGHLAVTVVPVSHGGWGASLLATNPRGDPDPRSPSTGANVDRLAMGGEAWGRSGGLSGWARWRSDLHADPSIADRTRAVADGLFFPASVSFSGGGAWRDAEVALRHDPQAMLWLSHVGSERTAGVTAGTAVMERARLRLDVEGRSLSSIEGRTVDPLDHLRGEATVRLDDRTRAGVEHERLVVDDVVDGRTRVVVDRSGRLGVRVAAGSDLVVGLTGQERLGTWSVEARLAFRSRPDPLHLDALLARGWTTGGTISSRPAPETVWDGLLRFGRGPLELEARGLLGEPVWAPDGVSRAHGGWMEAGWTDTLSFVSVEGRVRLASWGPDRAWWRETATASGRVEVRGALGAARTRAWATGRTEIRSARADLTEPAGVEVGLGLDVPLPVGGPRGGMTARAELEDVLDAGVPVRAGAPRRGRRLTIVLTWNGAGEP